MTNGATGPVGEKKGLSPLAWVGIGCGVLVAFGVVVSLVLGIFLFKKGKDVLEEATGGESMAEFVEGFQDNPAKVAAETLIRMDPDLEVVSTDDEEGTLTFRNRGSGEEITLDFEEIAEGRFQMSTDEGEFSYSVDEAGGEGGVTITGPDGEARFGASASLDDVPDWVPLYPGIDSTQSAYHSTQGEEVMGVLAGQTGDGADEVVEHYENLFEKKGWVVTSQSKSTTADGSFFVITAEDKESGRTLNVSAIEQNGETQVTLNYSG